MSCLCATRDMMRLILGGATTRTKASGTVAACLLLSLFTSEATDVLLTYHATFVNNTWNTHDNTLKYKNYVLGGQSVPNGRTECTSPAPRDHRRLPLALRFLRLLGRHFSGRTDAFSEKQMMIWEASSLTQAMCIVGMHPLSCH